MDVTDTQYSEPKYHATRDMTTVLFSCRMQDTEKTGVMTEKAQLVVPCEFDNVSVLNEKWIVAYVLKETTEDEYDFESYSDDTHYQIDTASIYHVSESEVSSVKLTPGSAGRYRGGRRLPQCSGPDQRKCNNL